MLSGVGMVRFRRWVLALPMVALLLAACSLVTDFENISGGQPDGGRLDAQSSAETSASDGGTVEVGSSDAGSDGYVGSDGYCGDGGSAEYEIAELGSDQSITIDGNCNDPIWRSVAKIPFYPANNFTNNGTTCRLVWKHEDVDRVYGCCEVSDEDIEAKTTQRDMGAWRDDRLEYFLNGDETHAFGATTTKVLLTPMGAVDDYDFGSDLGWWNVLYDAKVFLRFTSQGTANDAGDTDIGYSLEWSADVGFPVVPPRRALCGFSMGDQDEAIGNRDWLAFFPDGGADGGLNEPVNWGTCLFSCRRPGGT